LKKHVLSEWTGIQIAAAREVLEQDVESFLGRFLFSYSQLESELDLCLVWVNGGSGLDEWTRKIERSNFAGKLALLKNHVHDRASQEGRDAYEDWLARVHAIRERRNVLVHGRMALDVRRNILTIVISRATSASLKSVEFGLASREELVAETKSLFRDLSSLRRKYPL